MRSLLAALVLTASLTGCATRWVVDSDVRSFSEIASVPADATYRFERLPSQQYDEAAQLQLEAMAAPALESVGLRHDDAAARYTAQIGARVTSEFSPWVDPWYGDPWWGPGPWWVPGPRYGAWGYGRGWYGGGWYGPIFPQASNPWYSREVSIVLRELPSNRVVYETHARNDGPYNVSADVLPVMFQAALQGFPNPPMGERRVNLQIPTAKN
jgi:Domain of unknown function (DUF4136)